MAKIRLQYENGRFARSLFCNNESNLDLIEQKLKVKITSRDNFFILKGPEPNLEKTRDLFFELEKLRERSPHIHQSEFLYTLNDQSSQQPEHSDVPSGDKIELPGRRNVIVPKTPGQKRYVDTIKEHTLVFGIGPAGTGKTYLAMAMAVAALKTGQVRRIMLTRPAVEAGESLGFLPGDLYEKVLPYLRPLYDALYDMMDEESIERYRDRGIIEVVPLAYMRGRTLNDSFIILDEAQNTTIEQMRMFLTRLGFGSRAVITGDVTQIDLPSYRHSGLIQVQPILQGIDDIAFVYFDEHDVVRHPLVSKIIKAYETFDEHTGKNEKISQKKKTHKKPADQHDEA